MNRHDSYILVSAFFDRSRVGPAPSFSISIGGAPATVQYAGLAPNFVGLYQFNVVAQIVANYAAPVTFQVNGTTRSQTLKLAVQ